MLRCSIKITTPSGVVIFMDTERDFTCSGEIKLPCAKVLAFGQNVCTAQKRRQPEGRLGALSEPFAGSENIQIGVQFQKPLKTLVFGFFVAKSHFAGWLKISDPHAETAGKDKRAPDGKICLPARFFVAVLSYMTCPRTLPMVWAASSCFCRVAWV